MRLILTALVTASLLTGCGLFQEAPKTPEQLAQARLEVPPDLTRPTASQRYSIPEAPKPAVEAVKPPAAVSEPAKAPAAAPAPAPATPQPAGNALAAGFEARLKQLDTLKQRGLITDAEYQKKRQDILGAL